MGGSESVGGSAGGSGSSVEPVDSATPVDTAGSPRGASAAGGSGAVPVPPSARGASSGSPCADPPLARSTPSARGASAPQPSHQTPHPSAASRTSAAAAAIQGPGRARRIAAGTGKLSVATSSPSTRSVTVASPRTCPETTICGRRSPVRIPETWKVWICSRRFPLTKYTSMYARSWSGSIVVRLMSPLSPSRSGQKRTYSLLSTRTAIQPAIGTLSRSIGARTTPRCSAVTFPLL